MLKIHVLNVDHGDSLVLETIIAEKSHYSIIDCKQIGKSVPTVDFLRKREIVNIDTLFLTHLHEDHFSGIPALAAYLQEVGGTLEYYISPQIPQEIDAYAWILEQTGNGRYAESVIETLEDLYKLPSLTHDDRKVFVGRMIFDGDQTERAWKSHLHPNLLFAPVSPAPSQAFQPLTAAIKGSKSNPNDISHAMLLKYDSASSTNIGLLTGDLDNNYWRQIKNRCLAITKKEIRSKLRFLKMPHHGKCNDSVYKCLREIVFNNTPFFVSITCRPGDPKHPAEKTLAFLKHEFPNSCIACTNLSSHCSFPSSHATEDFFLAQSADEAEFLDHACQFGLHQPERPGSCAGDHVVILAEKFCRLVRTVAPSCEFLERECDLINCDAVS